MRLAACAGASGQLKGTHRNAVGAISFGRLPTSPGGAPRSSGPYIATKALSERQARINTCATEDGPSAAARLAGRSHSRQHTDGGLRRSAGRPARRPRASGATFVVQIIPSTTTDQRQAQRTRDSEPALRDVGPSRGGPADSRAHRSTSRALWFVCLWRLARSFARSLSTPSVRSLLSLSPLDGLPPPLTRPATPCSCCPRRPPPPPAWCPRSRRTLSCRRSGAPQS